MKQITNQTIYQCEYCNKRFVTKSGCKRHEKNNCRNENNPRIKNCTHDKIETKYTSMIGEPWNYEPDYDYCVDCGKIFY